MNNFYVMLILELIIVLLGTTLLIFVAKFPALFKLIFAKRCVWEIDGDGQMSPVKARTHSGAMLTENAVYPFTKNDVVRCFGLTGILAHKASDSRALNPRLMPVLSLFKQSNVDSLEDIEAILKAPLITEAKYLEMEKAQTAEAQEVSA